MESYLDENDSKQDESERIEIRSELSKMSFEDLQKLKAELGQKVYKEAMFGTKFKQTEFKRKNKNRPQEVSSKIKPIVIPKLKKNKRICDPRFDRLCGTFNEKHFKHVYDFLSDIKKREKTQLKKMLKKEKNPEEVKKIKYLVQRMENQEREEKQRSRKQEISKKEKEEQIEALKNGKKPYFRTKFEKKMVQLVDKYSELKKTGNIEKYIKRKQKKQNKKVKNKMHFQMNMSDNE